MSFSAAVLVPVRRTLLHKPGFSCLAAFLAQLTALFRITLQEILFLIQMPTATIMTMKVVIAAAHTPVTRTRVAVPEIVTNTF